MALISDFKTKMVGGGARPNQFYVQLAFPSAVGLVGGTFAAQQAQFLVKASQLPASTLEDISILYKGRPVHFAGERTFQPWSVTIYNDTSFNIRNSFEKWHDYIQNYATTNGETTASNYQTQMQVHQLDRGGAIIKSYSFINAYPTAISAIGLDYDQQNAIEQFDVEFTYDYFTSSTATAGSSFGVAGAINTPIGTFSI